MKALIVTTTHGEAFYGYADPPFDGPVIRIERARRCTYSAKKGPIIPAITIRDVLMVEECSDDVRGRWEAISP